MKKRTRIISMTLALIMCLGMIPATAYGAAEAGDPTYTGISRVSNEDFKTLGFDIDSKDMIEQAEDEASPYGNGYSSLVTVHELLTIDDTAYTGSGMTSDYLRQVYDDPLGKNSNKTQFRSIEGKGSIGMRSVAFDATGSGKPNFVAAVTATPEGKRTIIELKVSDSSSRTDRGDTIRLTEIPFVMDQENVGAYLSIAAGNFDGDDMNTQEIAVYVPFRSDEGSSLSGWDYGGCIRIYRVTQEKSGKVTLTKIGSYDLRNQSKYYFYDNETMIRRTDSAIMQGKEDKNYPLDDWRYMYYAPSLGLETVSQPGNADDLCITYSPAMGGNITEKTSFGGTINATRPYDSATSVFFWIDPLTAQQKKTSTTQMRWNWAADYGVPEDVDKNADKKWDVMTFGGAGAGDIDADGYSEVVIAGYMFDKRQLVMTDADSDYASKINCWDLSSEEYLATYFTYDPVANTYNKVDQAANWVSDKDDDYGKSTDWLGGVYSNYGDKDMIHQSLAVTCFADRGTGYGESIAIGGTVARLNTKNAVSAWTPYKDKGMGYAMFEQGTIDGIYAIPTETVNGALFGMSTWVSQNRLITETVAGNFDGNMLGMEQLAFAYLTKFDSNNAYYSLYGIIGQKEPGDQGKAVNINNKSKGYIDDGLLLKMWPSGRGDKLAPLTIAAVDTDDDSIIMRKLDKSNDYFFTDPEIIAVLQAAPYFDTIDYGSDNGQTSFGHTEGTSTETQHGITASVSVGGGVTAEVAIGFVSGITATRGFNAEFERSWGEGTTKSYGISYTGAMEDTVALIMTPNVRYYYEVFDPESKTWHETAIDVTRTPRTTLITVEEYDGVAERQGWETIMGNVLTSVAGRPETYAETAADLKGFTGAKTNTDAGDNFVRVGRSESSDITQTITVEKSDAVYTAWKASTDSELEVVASNVVVKVSNEIGYTGNKASVSFKELSYQGMVVGLPVAKDNYDYDFSWRFGFWEDSLMAGKEGDEDRTQTFPVLGFLVKEVVQPLRPIDDPLLHVVKSGVNDMTVSWLANEGSVTSERSNIGFVLVRESNGVYYPLDIFRLADAENGRFTFTDQYVEAFTGYEYALLPYAIGSQGQTIYGDYISNMTGYTAPAEENVPKVSVAVVSTTSDTQKLKANIKSAEGSNVGLMSLQWQVYKPEEGGWINVDKGFSTDTLTIPITEDAENYRCRVTQRVGTKIYTIDSNSRLSGSVYLAGRSDIYTDENGQKVVDYTMVHGDGKVEVVRSTDTRTYVGYIYDQVRMAGGGIKLMPVEDDSLSHRSVTAVDSDTVTLDGGTKFASDGGTVLGLGENTAVWDVKALVAAVGSEPLLAGGTTAEEALETLPDVELTVLKKDDWIAVKTGDSAIDNTKVVDTAYTVSQLKWQPVKADKVTVAASVIIPSSMWPNLGQNSLESLYETSRERMENAEIALGDAARTYGEDSPEYEAANEAYEEAAQYMNDLYDYISDRFYGGEWDPWNE